MIRVDANRLLIAYSALLTLAVAGAIGSGAVAQTGPATTTRFDTIDVRRINLREDDGTLRMVISNSSRAPGIIMHGKEVPHPSGNRGAGILFFNNEGSENGGLTFSGRKGPDGKVESGGHLSFDQYDQDQVIQLTQSEYGGRRWAAMIVNDRPDEPIQIELAKKITSMPDGPEKTALLKQVQEAGTFGTQRLYVGKTQARDSTIVLSDAKARPRITLKVSPDGRASIDFLDETGKIVRTVSPTTK